MFEFYLAKVFNSTHSEPCDLECEHDGVKKCINSVDDPDKDCIETYEVCV